MGCGQTYQQPFTMREVQNPVYLSGPYPTLFEPPVPNPVPPLGWLTRAARAKARRRGEKR